MTPAEFAATYGPQASAVSQGTGIEPDVLLAQWAVETAWGSSIFNSCNLGNIRCLSSVPCVRGFAQFPSFDSFVLNCISVWHNGYYGLVLAAVGAHAQLVAIGESPWDAGHYNNGGGPGSSIIAAYALIPFSGGTDDLTPQQSTDFDALIWRVEALISNAATVTGGPRAGEANAVKAELDAIKAAAPPSQVTITELTTVVTSVATALAVLDGKVNRILKELNTP